MGATSSMRESRSTVVIAVLAVAVLWLSGASHLRADCTGNCSGQGDGSGVYTETCPMQCPKAEDIQAAKSEARNNANWICQHASHNADCLCTGGDYELVSSSCTTVWDEELQQNVCVWSVVVNYDGGSCNIVE